MRKRQKFRTIQLICAAIVIICGMNSTAIGQAKKPTIFKFTCQLETASSERINAYVELGTDDQILFEINELPIDGTLVRDSMTPSKTIAFSATFMSTVYTLVVHIDYFMPYPIGYDPYKPPATLTKQYADAQVVPVVEIYVGSCERAIAISE